MDTNEAWRAVFNDEGAAWTAKSYTDLQLALSDVIAKKSCCVHYDREGPGGTYQVEVHPLETQPDYVHVLLTVFAPNGWRALSVSFIRYADGRLDV